MVIMVLGSGGQLGTAIRKRAQQEKRFSWVFLDRMQADVTKEDTLFAVVDEIKPGVIINCAALTNVDDAEKTPETAFDVNGHGAGNAGEAAARVDAKLIHISTDYVFEGCGIVEKGIKRPYRETDPTNPLTIYGQSKLLGEQMIQKGKSRHVILRTAWLYGGANCFVSRIIQQAMKGEELNVVIDEIGTPTSVEELGNAIEMFIENDGEGIFHASCQGQISRYEFARFILKKAKLNNQVNPVLSTELKRHVRRPLYSVLENQRLKQLNLDRFSHWKSALTVYLKSM